MVLAEGTIEGIMDDMWVRQRWLGADGGGGGGWRRRGGGGGDYYFFGLAMLFLLLGIQGQEAMCFSAQLFC
jgi:hypothetical protein